jgi:hypothetical protein
MGNRILLVGMMCLFLVFNGCNSDSDLEKEPSKEPVKEIKTEVEVDYVLNEEIDDFVINNDNTIFKVGEWRGEGKDSVAFMKVDLLGNVKPLKMLNIIGFYQSQLMLTNEGNVFLIAPIHDVDYDKMFLFKDNFSKLEPFYTMAPLSSPGPSPFFDRSRLWVFTAVNDKTCFVFDSNERTIKRVFLESKSETFVAGSGKNVIKDGIGQDAGFGDVNEMISQDGTFYIIDKWRVNENFLSYNIRKMEFVNNAWKVVTLISSSTDDYRSVSFDSKGDLYVLIGGKGIYKLNLQNNALTLFKGGKIKIKSGNNHSVIDLGSFAEIKIKDKDLYLRAETSFVKISDFQSKFNSLSN